MIRTLTQFVIWVLVIAALSASPLSDFLPLLALALMGVGIANGMKEVKR